MAGSSSTGASSSVSRLQLLTSIFQQAITGYTWKYWNTYPGGIPSLINIFLGIANRETNLGYNHGSPYTSPDTYQNGVTHIYWYQDPVIVNARTAAGNAGQTTVIQNLQQGYAAHGLMQVMGYHNIYGETTSRKGKGYFQTPTYLPIANANNLLVPPGQDIDGLYWGSGVPLVTGLTRGAIGGMIVLENKYDAYINGAKGHWGTATNGNFNLAMSNAIGSYLGTGKDKFGTTPDSYLASVMDFAHNPTTVAVNNTSSGSSTNRAAAQTTLSAAAVGC